MKKIILIVFFVLSVIVIKSQNYTFSQATFTNGVAPTNALKGDFNNDGEMDIIMQSQDGLKTYLQMPSNTFSIVVTTYTSSLKIFQCSDFNGDGNTDVLANNNHLFLGNGNGTFSLTTINQNFSSYTSISSDFNNDGIKDVASVTSNTNALLSIFIGQGNGNFNISNSYTVNGVSNFNYAYTENLEASRIAVNDLNNDSNQDLVISTVVTTGTVNTGYLSVYLGNGNGTFNSVNTYTYNFDITTVKISDMNIDGINDIIFSSSGGVYVLQGDGLGSFAAYYNQSISSSSIDIGDMNNDGKMDIINFYGMQGFICSATSTVSIIDNNGASFSVNTNTFSVNAYYGLHSPVFCEDFNNDGKIDLAVNTYSCTPTLSICYNTTNIPISTTINISNSSCFNMCNGSATVTATGGAGNYNINLSNGTVFAGVNTAVFTNLCAGSYSYSVSDGVNTAVGVFNIYEPSSLNIIASVNSATVCEGSCEDLFIAGTGGTPPYSYSWTPNSNTNNTVNICPVNSTTYTAFVTDGNGCTAQSIIDVTVDNTCADVWPGDANSDGSADNLDVLELGLHYTQTGTPRATTDNSWQSFHADNWVGTITNGKNLNHSDCNGDGTINDNDTLAIYYNYGLTHTFRPAQTSTVNPQLSIVPDQASVLKGTWGTASIYLGDAAANINNINGVAFTIDFDNTLIETNSIYIEYQNSFIDAGQNLHFRKLDFANGKLFTASTHTVNNNVSGFGKIGTLHYKIKSTLTADQILNLGISQSNQSDASGTIIPLTSGTGTLMALGASVGLQQLNGNLISISPNPTNGSLTINSKTELQKIEVVSITGQVLLSEVPTNVYYTLHLDNFANGIYFVNIYQNNRIVKREKVMLNK
ncbi:MAG: FG-GAP-like repeat-containing protein [Bacteroidia bacterium]